MHGGTRRRSASRRVKGTGGYEAIFKLLKAIKRKFLNTCPNRLFPPFLPANFPSFVCVDPFPFFSLAEETFTESNLTLEGQKKKKLLILFKCFKMAGDKLIEAD